MTSRRPRARPARFVALGIALGLVAFGLYSLAAARYRRPTRNIFSRCATSLELSTLSSIGHGVQQRGEGLLTGYGGGRGIPRTPHAARSGRGASHAVRR